MRDKFFRPIKISRCERFCLIYWPCFCLLASKGQGKKRKLIQKGASLIEKQLDTKYMLRLLNAFRQILRHNFSKNQRTLLFFQRRSTVLETPTPQKSHSSSDEIVSDPNKLKTLQLTEDDLRLKKGVFFVNPAKYKLSNQQSRENQLQSMVIPARLREKSYVRNL